MSNLSPALAFPSSPAPLVLSAARSLAARLDAGEVITRPILNTVLTEQFGGSDADARWSVRDAHAALELAQVCRFPLRIDPVFPSRIDPGEGMSRRAGFWVKLVIFPFVVLVMQSWP